MTRILGEGDRGDRLLGAVGSEIEARNHDFKAVNPNPKVDIDTRTPEELRDETEVQGWEVASALAEMRALLAAGGEPLVINQLAAAAWRRSRDAVPLRRPLARLGKARRYRARAKGALQTPEIPRSSV